MAEIERLTITLPSDMAAAIKDAVNGGDYASTSEVVREALRDWKMKRALQLHELAALKADIDKGLTDVAEGRVKDFDADRIIERGKKLLVPFVIDSAAGVRIDGPATAESIRGQERDRG